MKKLETADPLADLRPNQFFLCNLADGISVSQLIGHFKKNGILIDSVQFKKNFLGSVVGALVETKAVHAKEDLVQVAHGIKSHGKKLRIMTASDAAFNPVDKRTIVISNIDPHEPMPDILRKIDQIAPVVTFEFAVRYTNTALTETEELLLQLHSNQQLRQKLAGKKVEIHETNGDKVNVIKLNPDLTIENPNKRDSRLASPRTPNPQGRRGDRRAVQNTSEGLGRRPLRASNHQKQVVSLSLSQQNPELRPQSEGRLEANPDDFQRHQRARRTRRPGPARPPVHAPPRRAETARRKAPRLLLRHFLLGQRSEDRHGLRPKPLRFDCAHH